MKSTFFFVVLFATVTVAAAFAQSDDDPTVPPEQETLATDREAGLELEQLGDLEIAPAVPRSDEDEEADAAGRDPLAEIDAQESGEIEASMERFEPSEKISEDRSVAFPNDI